MMKLKILCPMIVFLFSASLCRGQLKLPELSPAGTIVQRVGFTTIRVYYERPAVRGRAEKEIFGDLVPWGQVWRTGAGNCTKISFSTDVIIHGERIPGGTYSLFTIPDKRHWTIILNTDTVSYGTYAYDEKKDVTRFIVPSGKTKRFYHSLTIDIDVIPNDARIYLSWLNTQLAFDVRTGVDQEIMSFINDNLIVRDSDDPEVYEKAIQYYLWHRDDRKQVRAFIERGIQLKDQRIWYYWKIRDLMEDKKYTEALQAANRAIAVIRESQEEEPRKIELIKDFEDLISEIRNKQK